MIGSLRGTLLDRGADEVTVEVGGRRLPRHGQPHHRGVARRRRRTRSSAGSTTTSARTPSPSTASPPRTSGRASRRCSAPTASGPALALAILSVHTPVALARILAEDDLGALCLVPGRRQEDGGPPAHRAQVAPVGARPRRRPACPAAAPTPTARPRARADVREALAGLGYSEPEVREVMADLPADGDAGALLRDALQRLAAARR